MRALALVILTFSFFACSSQNLDRDGGDLTRGEVEFLSTRMSAAIETEFPLLKHKLVNRYVSSLGQAIISRNPDMPPLPYEFRVLKSNEIFAFSLPGGIIYVSLGMLRAMEFEGQFASALAHELAHQQLNHQLIHWRKKVNANRGGKFLLSFEGEFKDDFLGESGAIYLEPGQEEEADKLAAVILYRAEFDPRLYTSYLQQLKKYETSEPQRVATLLSLHPPLKDRLAWAKNALLTLPPMKDPNVSSQTFQQLKLILKDAEKKSEKPVTPVGKK